MTTHVWDSFALLGLQFFPSISNFGGKEHSQWMGSDAIAVVFRIMTAVTCYDSSVNVAVGQKPGDLV